MVDGTRLTSSFAPLGRRLLDIILALIALLLVSPIFVLIMMAVRLETRGPVFFFQTRLGRAGQHFRLIKFRKLRGGVSTTEKCVTLKGDARMTRIGSLLEQTKLNELPQLWNILVGDMALVGPRPESLDFAHCFTGEYQRVLDHKPGLFGPNQVLFRAESAMYPKDSDPVDFYCSRLFPLKATVDLIFFERRTLLSDLKWIVYGLMAVLRLPLPGMWNQTSLRGIEAQFGWAGDGVWPSAVAEAAGRDDGRHLRPITDVLRPDGGLDILVAADGAAGGVSTTSPRAL